MIEQGKTVAIHYKGTLDDGSIFDSSENREPLEFTVGSGQVIPGFDAAVRDMSNGETKTIKIPCEEAYGKIRDEMIADIPREQFPKEISPEVGQMLQVSTPEGAMPVRVIEVREDCVVIDCNHPLAGQDLTFELTVVSVS